ncbi:MAG: Obg family GTPase CgtA, partial [Actinomycetia bacterium]|nr:Obg family GTPase CgtA [Actinomycetes bacterium]
VPGGQGGRGNASFTTPKRQAPSFAEKGEPGEEKKILLELKILANVGLVGFPNVGKSSLISRISAARPKVAEYPFTTIIPHLGVVFLDDGRSFSVADVPGLIEGAHHGKGMGTAFLKHLERTVVLLHIIDLASVEGRDPIIDFETIQKEVELYGSSFTTKKSIVAGNKIDLPRARKNLDAVTAYFNNKKIPFFPISAATGEGITPLIYYLADSLEKKETHVSEKVIVYELEESHDLIIDKTKEGWEIKNKKLERIVQMTDLNNEEAVAYLQERMKRFHLEEELLAKGAIEGDKVKISGFEFDFLPKT